MIEKKLLGVCVGMQMLAESSDEGNENGLGWINANVKIFEAQTIEHTTKLPLGWNNADIISESDPSLKLEQRDFISYIHTSLNVEK